jgi:hypothetical protein
MAISYSAIWHNAQCINHNAVLRHHSCLPLHYTPASIIAVVIFQIINTLELREEELEEHQKLRIR